MITRLVKLTFRNKEANHFIVIFNESKEKILSFEGCNELKLLCDKSNPNVFFTYSVWESEVFLEKYRNSELFKTTWGKTKKLFLKNAEAWTLDRKF